jgi:hypothetical protein
MLAIVRAEASDGEVGMTKHADNWAKPRSHGTHFTPDEIQRIHDAYRANYTTTETARDLKCSSRVVSTWFAKFRSGWKPGTPRRVRGKYEAPTAAPVAKSAMRAPNAMPSVLAKLTRGRG